MICALFVGQLGARDLRNEQIHYAMSKAYASYSIGDKLMRRGHKQVTGMCVMLYSSFLRYTGISSNPYNFLFLVNTMDIYASYEVQIQGTRSKIMARIAYTPRQLNSFLNELRTHILHDQNHVENNQSENKTEKPAVVGLALISSFYDRVIVMQLCFGTCCVIIQLNYLDLIPEPLETFLADEDIAFAGVDIRSGLGILKTNYGLECNSVIELGTLADRVYRKSKYSGATLEELASEVGIGFEIEKPTCLTNQYWTSRDLSNEQIEYATITAYASYLIGNKLLTSGGHK